METVEIAKSEYDELRSRPERRELDEATERAAKAERDLEAAETAKVAAEKENGELKAKVQTFEEQARQSTLRDERLDALGAGFTGALGDKTKERLRKQAGELEDAEWSARLDELEELTGKKRDLGAENKSKGSEDGTFTREEIARHQGGGSGDPDNATPNQRRAVLARI